METNTFVINIRKATCHVLYAYDIGISTNLAKCLERLEHLGGNAALSNQNRRAPKYFGYDPQPQTIVLEAQIPQIGSHSVSSSISLTFYDFGAVSISYEIPISGTLDDLRDLSIELGHNGTLLTDSRSRAQTIVAALGNAVDHPLVATPVEDYLLFEITDCDMPCPANEILLHAGPTIAQILRAEKRELSKQETEDALACHISYTPGDITLIDWNAAMVFDTDTSDVRAVLEFANTELLELRFLDYQLDSSLDRSYELTRKPHRILQLLPGIAKRNIAIISQMQLEGAILFERVSNAPKLLGDQYLARVYRLAAQRFHVGEWNSSILRKLDTIEDFHKQTNDNAATDRLELLEWIVIILIALEIILPLSSKFIPGIH